VGREFQRRSSRLDLKVALLKLVCELRWWLAADSYAIRREVGWRVHGRYAPQCELRQPASGPNYPFQHHAVITEHAGGGAPTCRCVSKLNGAREGGSAGAPRQHGAGEGLAMRDMRYAVGCLQTRPVTNLASRRNRLTRPHRTSPAVNPWGSAGQFRGTGVIRERWPRPEILWVTHTMERA
jgi:hypothetical protein